MTSKRIAAGLVALAALAMPAAAAAPTPSSFAWPVAAAAPAITVGRPAPDADIILVDGTRLKLSDLRGEVVLLNFWATWCAPCKVELPILDRYYALQKRHGLRVYAVTTESSLPLYRLRKLFAVMQIPAARKIGAPYDAVRAVPTNYIIDRAGIVRYAKAASFGLDDLNRELVLLLQEPAPAS